MATQADLDRYVASVRGLYIDMDRVFGAQCWDQWSHYATNFLGVPSWPTYTNAGGSQPHSGYACNVWHNARAAGLEQWFEIIPAGAQLQPGDVLFWEFGSAWFPLSHVATLLAVMPNGMLRCLTQNPGAVQIADLIRNGLLGALRPRAFIHTAAVPALSPTLTASEKLARTVRRRKGQKHMFIYNLEQGAPRYAVLELGIKGSWWEFTGQDTANAIASQRGNAALVLIDGWNDLKKRHS